MKIGYIPAKKNRRGGDPGVGGYTSDTSKYRALEKLRVGADRWASTVGDSTRGKYVIRYMPYYYTPLTLDEVDHSCMRQPEDPRTDGLNHEIPLY